VSAEESVVAAKDNSCVFFPAYIFFQNLLQDDLALFAIVFSFLVELVGALPDWVDGVTGQLGGWVDKFNEDVLRLLLLGVAGFVTLVLAVAARGLRYFFDRAAGHF